MRILVFSDTHGYVQNCTKVIETIKSIDLVLHLGDTVRDAEDLHFVYPDIRFEYVAGNNDFSSLAPYEKLIYANNKKIFLTHGHTYGVKSSLTRLADKATDLHADIALFGHTHVPLNSMTGNVCVLNPGACGYISPTYGIIEIENGIINSCILTV